MFKVSPCVFHIATFHAKPPVVPSSIVPHVHVRSQCCNEHCLYSTVLTCECFYVSLHRCNTWSTDLVEIRYIVALLCVLNNTIRTHAKSYIFIPQRWGKLPRPLSLHSVPHTASQKHGRVALRESRCGSGPEIRFRPPLDIKLKHVHMINIII